MILWTPQGSSDSEVEKEKKSAKNKKARKEKKKRKSSKTEDGSGKSDPQTPVERKRSSEAKQTSVERKRSSDLDVARRLSNRISKESLNPDASTKKREFEEDTVRKDR